VGWFRVGAVVAAVILRRRARLTSSGIVIERHRRLLR
jgi:hypothetical protein